MNEEWRTIPEFPDYEVSDQGRVRSWKNNRWGRAETPRVLKVSPDNTGYRRVTLNGHTYRHVHILVLEAFTGPRPGGPYDGAHENGDALDNRLVNLTWKTVAENNEDKRLHGTLPLGEDHQNARLTEHDVRWARIALSEGWTQREVAAVLGVVPGTISAVVRGITWAGVG